MKRAQWHPCADLESDRGKVRWSELRAGIHSLNVYQHLAENMIEWGVEVNGDEKGHGKEKTVQLAKRAAKAFARKMLTEALEKLG